MSEPGHQDVLAAALHKVVENHIREFDPTMAEVLGCLECVKLEL